MSVKDRKGLFSEKVTALAKALNRTVKGYLTIRSLLGLEWMLGDDEPKPAIFTDAAYKKLSTEILTTDCLENDLFECGKVLPGPPNIWMHFQALDDRVHFSVWGNEMDAEEFRKLLEEAAKSISAILT